MSKDKNVELVVVVKHPFCANTECSNKIGEGTFHVLKLRGIKLVICTPCSDKLREIE